MGSLTFQIQRNLRIEQVKSMFQAVALASQWDHDQCCRFIQYIGEVTSKINYFNVTYFFCVSDKYLKYTSFNFESKITDHDSAFVGFLTLVYININPLPMQYYLQWLTRTRKLRYNEPRYNDLFRATNGLLYSPILSDVFRQS